MNCKSVPFSGTSHPHGNLKAMGNPAVSGVAGVGERGPELISPRSPGTGQPIKPGKGGVGYGRERAYNISISQTFNGNGSSASVRQVRAAARDGVMAAVRDR